MTTKTILAGTLTAAALALTGGAAYAATSGGPATPAPALTRTVTTTVQHSQPAATYPRHGNGNCCRDSGWQRTTARPVPGTTTLGSSNHGYRCDYRYHDQDFSQYGYQGNGSRCCGNGWQH